MVAIERIPSRCYLCKRWGDDFRTCGRCRRQSPLLSVRTATAYKGVAKDLVSTLKFGRAKGAAVPMARSLAGIIGVPGGLYITHVPTANARVRERGYDQAALIAKELAVQTSLPYSVLLARTGAQRQTGQGRDIRKAQMEGAFRVLRADMLQGKHVLLVDDVLTTGATCEAAARALRQAGARTVSAAVFAAA